MVIGWITRSSSLLTPYGFVNVEPLNPSFSEKNPLLNPADEPGFSKDNTEFNCGFPTAAVVPAVQVIR
jgi:hypothetical protein